jgi:cytochrome b6-f complex iron-sulfur subunit
MDRWRRWLLGAGWFGFLISLVGPALANVRFLFPNVVYEPPTRVKLGRPEDYVPGSVTFVEGPRVYLFREPDGFRTVSAICTHLRCTIGPFQGPSHEWSFPHSICPCHGSVFGTDGKVWRGPAPRDLDRHPVELSPDGRLIVDTGDTVGKDYRLKV